MRSDALVRTEHALSRMVVFLGAALAADLIMAAQESAATFDKNLQCFELLRNECFERPFTVFVPCRRDRTWWLHTWFPLSQLEKSKLWR